MEQQDFQNRNLPLASHPELHMFKLAQIYITSTPIIPGQSTTEIPMISLYEVIQKSNITRHDLKNITATSLSIPRLCQIRVNSDSPCKSKDAA